MKKADIILLIAILALSAAGFFLFAVSGRKGGSYLEIRVDNELYGTYNLSEDQEIKINDTNICTIKNGEVTMTWADCPDQTCVKSGAITGEGGSIICLPNRVSLSITGNDESGKSYDAVAE